MAPFFKSLTLTSVIALSGAAFAQETTPTTTEGGTVQATTAEGGAEQTTATEDTPVVDPLERSMGVEVADENAPGTVYVRETYGDWEMQCFRVAEGQQEPCQLYQLLKGDGGNGLAEINFVNLPEGQQAAAGATIVTPLETLLTQQLTLSVDGGATKRYPFTYCSKAGCYSRIGFSNGDIASFKRGASASVTVVPVAAPNQKVTASVSLTGFTDGYNAIIAANKREQ